MAYLDAEVFCAIYVRLSEEDRDKRNEEDDSRSIQNQKSMLRAFAETNGWNIYKIYSDEDYAGADRSRPAFNELLKDAEAKKFSIVLCKSQSRFTREMELVEHYLHDLFPQWGIRFVGLVDNADTAVKGNKKARQINGLVNEWYLEDLSENIKEVLHNLHEKGYFTGAFAPYGYKKDPDYKGHLLPDEEAAQIVHRIFEMYAEGWGKVAIARQLNAEKIPNPTEYKRLHGIRWKRYKDTERSALWQYFSVADILTNEVYIGNMVQGKVASTSYKTKKVKSCPKEQWIRVPNTHAPIIERELWEKVQDIVRKKAKPGWNGERGIFSRKVRCMYCGYTLRSGKAHGNIRYLKCSSRHVDATYCQGSYINLKNLERIVLQELQKMIHQYLDEDAAEQYIQIKNEIAEQRKTVQKQLGQLQEKLDNANYSLRMLYQDRVSGIITPEDFTRLSAAFKEDLKETEEAVKLHKRQLEELDEQERKRASKREILTEMMNLKELNRDIVDTLIDYIEVGRRKEHAPKEDVPVVIHWKF